MDIIESIKKECLRRKLSIRTMKSYTYCVKKFLIYCKKEPKSISKQDIKDYLNILISRNKSGSTINVYLNALKFLIEEVLNRNFNVKIKYSKVPKTLPIVLTQEEIYKLINEIKNSKHKLMVKLMYSSGLRVNELVNLRVMDLDFNSNYGWGRHGKGNKDRLFIIADTLKPDLMRYIGENNLEHDSWLFNSYNGHISVRTIQVIVKKAAKKAKIPKNVHCHTLRHSFATHIIQDGNDIVSLQTLLGHNSAETTMRYVHMVSPKLINVRSPLDNLNFNEKDNSQLEKDYEKSEDESKNTLEMGQDKGKYNKIRI